MTTYAKELVERMGLRKPNSEVEPPEFGAVADGKYDIILLVFPQNYETILNLKVASFVDGTGRYIYCNGEAQSAKYDSQSR
ncbi:hypothetical protein V6N13_047355 [Hibiscus sabdariffa]|uniref:Uncharacterized protein n=1 Tax=Hibiscus sabdariffa TaxID=183260 RepID=A0ABR2F3X2_9ROSI